MQVSREEFLEYATPRLNFIYGVDFDAPQDFNKEAGFLSELKGIGGALKGIFGGASKAIKTKGVGGTLKAMRQKGFKGTWDTLGRYGNQGFHDVYNKALGMDLAKALKAGDAYKHLNPNTVYNILDDARKLNGGIMDSLRAGRAMYGSAKDLAARTVAQAKNMAKGTAEAAKSTSSTTTALAKPVRTNVSEPLNEAMDISERVAQSGMGNLGIAALTTAGIGAGGMGGYYLGKGSGRREAEELYNPALQLLLQRNMQMMQNNQSFLNRLGNVFTGNVTNV